jgi:hypothetical protein
MRLPGKNIKFEIAFSVRFSDSLPHAFGVTPLPARREGRSRRVTFEILRFPTYEFSKIAFNHKDASFTSPLSAYREGSSRIAGRG